MEIRLKSGRRLESDRVSWPLICSPHRDETKRLFIDVPVSDTSATLPGTVYPTLIGGRAATAKRYRVGTTDEWLFLFPDLVRDVLPIARLRQYEVLQSTPELIEIQRVRPRGSFRLRIALCDVLG